MLLITVLDAAVTCGKDLLTLSTLVLLAPSVLNEASLVVMVCFHVLIPGFARHDLVAAGVSAPVLISTDPKVLLCQHGHVLTRGLLEFLVLLHVLSE